MPALRRSRTRRTCALAQRLKRASPTPEDYVAAVARYLGDAASPTRDAAAGVENLDGFLFDAKTGYCQQFSGAMALLLRMAGIPARVSTGFTPARSTEGQASTSCATSTPTRGSRSGTRATAG